MPTGLGIFRDITILERLQAQKAQIRRLKPLWKALGFQILERLKQSSLKFTSYSSLLEYHGIQKVRDEMNWSYPDYGCFWKVGCWFEEEEY